MVRAPTTAALYRTIASTYVIPRIGGVRLEALSPGDLTNLYRDLLAGGGRGGRALAPKTVRHVHTTLRRALEDAVDSRHLSWNPASAAKAPRVVQIAKSTPWTADDVRTFLAKTSGTRLEALWILAATTGMRRGEMLGLRWADVSLHSGEAKIRQTHVSYGRVRVTKEPKTERSRRTIPLPAATLEALRRHRRQQTEERLAAGPAWSDSGLVFTDEIGRALHPATASWRFKQDVRKSGLPPLTLQWLRHTFATLGLEASMCSTSQSCSGTLRRQSPSPSTSTSEETDSERPPIASAPRSSEGRSDVAGDGRTTGNRRPVVLEKCCCGWRVCAASWCRRGDLNPHEP